MSDRNCPYCGGYHITGCTLLRERHEQQMRHAEAEHKARLAKIVGAEVTVTFDDLAERVVRDVAESMRRAAGR